MVRKQKAIYIDLPVDELADGKGRKFSVRGEKVKR